MRLAVTSIAIALCSPARADPCSGDATPSPECNALWVLLGKGGAMSTSAGWLSESFDPAGHSFDVTRAGALNTIGHFTGGLAPIHANGFYIDVRVHPAPHWYVGIDLGAAFGGSVNPAFAARGGDTITWDSSSVMTMAAVAGARLPLGPLSLRAEVVAGIHGAELGSMTDTPQGLAASTVAPLVAPRVAADLWIHRWWVIEAYAGVNALDRSERMFGLGLGFHSQAFDGRR